MKNLSIIAAALLASSAFAGTVNYDNDAGAVAFNSTLTRAEVKSEYAQAAKAGQLPTVGEEFAVKSTQTRSTADRSQVHAEAVQAARDTLVLN